jgi:hypothetical protein
MMNYTIRQVTVSDAVSIAGHRVAMFRDMGQVPTDALATALMSASTDALAALLREGALHASDAGRSLYLSLGFVPTNEMRWPPTCNGRGGRAAIR